MVSSVGLVLSEVAVRGQPSRKCFTEKQKKEGKKEERIGEERRGEE